MLFLKLNDGHAMPQLGFGTYLLPPEQTAQAVYEAIKVGYRHIDTAVLYHNEKETGEGIARAIAEGIVKREDLFVTSKVFIGQINEQDTAQTIDNSLKSLGLDYIDLYLIHQPYNDIYGAWRALVAAQKAGKVRSIGVSNFSAYKLVEFATLNDVKPAVNQIEVNPWYQRNQDLEYNEKLGVAVTAWAPFAQGKNDLFTNPTLATIGAKYGKNNSQVVLRWLLQRGIAALAKTTSVERMKENLNVFDFELSQEDMNTIASLDLNKSAFFSHQDPAVVERFMNFVKPKALD